MIKQLAPAISMGSWPLSKGFNTTVRRRCSFTLGLALPSTAPLNDLRFTPAFSAIPSANRPLNGHRFH